jgi:hypothetical protein
MRNARKIVNCICAKSASKLVAQMKGEYVILVLKTADEFRATIGALLSLGEINGVSSHNFLSQTDRLVRLLKNESKRMPSAGSHAAPIAVTG